jgi:DAK2 domain fusion protein YloV
MEHTQASSTEGNLTCDGQLLKRLTAGALAWLEHNHRKIDALNVFPVPDGDTGTNMLLTMRSAYQEIAHNDSSQVGTIARTISHGALMGARGNSGVILSQLWRGFARVVDSVDCFDAGQLAAGLREACDTAYQGVIRPVEGTILTVAREIAEEAAATIEETSDLIQMLERLVARAQLAVERTPEQLPVLKKAGVVDAGGMGLAVLLEGTLLYLQGQTVELPAEVEAGAVVAPLPEDKMGYGYDVQFILKGSDMDVQTVREAIDAMGDSTLVVGDGTTIKVHVHVHDPGRPLSYGTALGVLSDVVVENMQEQFEEFARAQSAAVLPVPTPVAVEEGDIAVVAVVSGDGLVRVFQSLGVARIVPGGQTMNPSTEALLGAINNLPTHRVVIFPNNENVVLAAQQAAQMAQGQDIDARVVPTVTVPQGISALMTLNPQGDFEAVVRAMNIAKDQVSTAEVTIATRSVEINGVAAKKGQFIGLLDGDLTQAGDDPTEVVLKLLAQMHAHERELITLYSGNGVSAQQTEDLASQMRAQFPEQEVEVVQGGQPHYHFILSAE